MSIVVSSRLGRGQLGSMVDYLEREKAGSTRARVEHAICDLGDDPAGFNGEARRLLDSTTRKNDGQSLVISFTEAEFPSDGDHGQEVAEHAYELVRRGAPNAPLLVVAQRDGAGGRWHAHVLVVNHDMQTGGANRGLWKHTQWRALNDEYNREMSLEVCGQEATLSRTARLAAARGVELQADEELTALAPSQVPKNDVDRYLGAVVLGAIADGHLDRVPTDGEGISIALTDHPGHHLSVRAKGTGLSYAITDGDGAPVMCAAGARGGKPRRIASTGTKLDKALALGRADATYTRDGLAELLAVMEQELEQEQEKEDERDRERQAATDEGRTGEDRSTVEHVADTSGYEFDELDRAVADTRNAQSERAGGPSTAGQAAAGGAGEGGSPETGGERPVLGGVGTDRGGAAAAVGAVDERPERVIRVRRKPVNKTELGDHPLWFRRHLGADGWKQYSEWHQGLPDRIEVADRDELPAGVRELPEVAKYYAASTPEAVTITAKGYGIHAPQVRKEYGSATTTYRRAMAIRNEKSPLMREALIDRERRREQAQRSQGQSHGLSL